jgi:hypothetical protein
MSGMFPHLDEIFDGPSHTIAVIIHEQKIKNKIAEVWGDKL